jgi:TetR/AcrR family transcriptional regulator
VNGGRVKRIAGETRTAILAAAATEFAAHGFAGASVDAIAARSRFNKAMIYYHFKSKQGLYVEILRDGFRYFGDRTAEIADSALAPGDKLGAFIDAFNDMAASRPYMPPMMMREMAEGAVRLDADTLRLMARVFESLRRILDEGARLGAFRRMDPILTYFSLVAPIIFFRASAPIREAFGRQHVIDLHNLDTGIFVEHHKAAALTVLTAGMAAGASAKAGVPAKASAKAGVSAKALAKADATRKARRTQKTWRTRSSRPGDHA